MPPSGPWTANFERIIVLTNEGFALVNILDVHRSQENVITVAKTIADQGLNRLVPVRKTTAVRKAELGLFYENLSDPFWKTNKPKQPDKQWF